MVHERFQGLFFVLIPPKLGRTAVTDNNLWRLSVHQPIDQRKDRQAQTISKRHQDDAAQHDQAAGQLIEIFHQIELPATAKQTRIKNIGPLFDDGQRPMAIGAAERSLTGWVNGSVFLACKTTAGERGAHKGIPNLIR